MNARRTTLPVDLHRCTCGHITEWHYVVAGSGQKFPGAPMDVPVGSKARCCAANCDCAQVLAAEAVTELPIVARHPVLR